MTAPLEFRDVTVRLGTGSNAIDAVRSVNLTVPAGSIVGLVGESGSGKSTLARAAVGLVEPTSGSILLDGVDVAHATRSSAKLRREIQMVFQDPYSCLDPRITIGGSIDEALAALGRRDPSRRLKPAERIAEVRRLLGVVHINPNRHTDYPSTLSGGERQRIALARALAAGPRVLLADEITSALDVSIQGSVLNLLLELQREYRLTVLFISHNLAVVRHICDEVAVMRRGELIEVGPVLEVLEAPREAYTRELVSAVPRIGVPLFDTAY